MVDSVRSRGTGPLTSSRRPGGDGPRAEGGGEAREAERRVDGDQSDVDGRKRLHKQGDMGGVPWGGEGACDTAYSNSCVSSMFTKEWQAQRPDEFKAAAKALRDYGEFEVNGQTIKLDDQRRETLASKGLLESDEAVVDAALLGTARANTGQNSEGGTDAEGVAFLEDTLQLGVNLAEGDDVQVGDYVAVGSATQKHFMKVVGDGEGSLTLQDAQGNAVKMSKADVASHSNVDDGDNLGAGSAFGTGYGTKGKRPPR